MSTPHRNDQQEMDRLEEYLQQQFTGLYEFLRKETEGLVRDRGFLALSPDEKIVQLDEHAAKQNRHAQRSLQSLTNELPYDTETRKALHAGLDLLQTAIVACAGKVGAVIAVGLAVGTLWKAWQEARLDRAEQLGAELAEQRSPEERRKDADINALLEVSNQPNLPDVPAPDRQPARTVERSESSLRDDFNVAAASPKRQESARPGIAEASQLLTEVAVAQDFATVLRDLHRATDTDASHSVMQTWHAAAKSTESLAVRNAETLDRVHTAVGEERCVHDRYDKQHAIERARLTERQNTRDLSPEQRQREHEQLDKIVVAARNGAVVSLYERALEERQRER